MMLASSHSESCSQLTESRCSETRRTTPTRRRSQRGDSDISETVLSRTQATQLQFKLRHSFVNRDSLAGFTTFKNLKLSPSHSGCQCH